MCSLVLLGQNNLECFAMFSLLIEQQLITTFDVPFMVGQWTDRTHSELSLGVWQRRRLVFRPLWWRQGWNWARCGTFVSGDHQKSSTPAEDAWRAPSATQAPVFCCCSDRATPLRLWSANTPTRLLTSEFVLCGFSSGLKAPQMQGFL